MTGVLIKSPNDEWCILDLKNNIKFLGLLPEDNKVLNIARNNKQNDELLMSMPYVDYEIKLFIAPAITIRYADITNFINQLKSN